MEELAALLAALPDIDTLSDDDLVAFRDELRAAAVEARGERGAPLPADVGQLLQAAADFHGQLTVAQQGRAEMATQLITEADHIIDTFAPVASGGDEPALAAAASSPRRAAAVPARHRPRIHDSRAVTMVASGGGGPISDDDALIDSIFEAGKQARAGEKRYVAKVDWENAHVGEIVSTSRSAADNGAALARAASEFVDRRRQRSVLLASGGIPGPPEPLYVLPVWGSTARPLRDSLPSLFSARGELTYNMAPSLEDIAVDTGAGAVGVVTASQDLAGATKNIQTVGAPTPKTAVVEADTLRLQHGHFSDRFLPEFTRAWLHNAQVAFARHNETRLFNAIAAGSTHMVDTPAHFGAWRDLLRAILGIVEELGDRLRDPQVPITIVLPEYVPAMLASDLIAQAPGDQAWSITEEAVRARLQSLNPNVDIVFTWDGNQTRQRLLTTPSGQSPRTPAFDADVDLLAFPTGAWAFLDGGVLDLGVIRDSVLSATNQFQTFFESWEAVAQLAPFSYRATISLCADGASQAASAVNVCSPQGS